MQCVAAGILQIPLAGHGGTPLYSQCAPGLGFAAYLVSTHASPSTNADNKGAIMQEFMLAKDVLEACFAHLDCQCRLEGDTTLSVRLANSDTGEILLSAARIQPEHWASVSAVASLALTLRRALALTEGAGLDTPH